MNTMFSKIVAIMLLGMVLLMSGCASVPGFNGGNQYGYQSYPRPVQSSMFYGRVIQLQTVETQGRISGGGALLGGVLGGLVGNQFGHGKGKTFTTVGGVVAGGVVGNGIESQRSRNLETIAVIQLDCGYILNVPPQNSRQLWMGDRVQVFVTGNSMSVSNLTSHNSNGKNYREQVSYQNQRNYQNQNNYSNYHQETHYP